MPGCSCADFALFWVQSDKTAAFFLALFHLQTLCPSLRHPPPPKSRRPDPPELMAGATNMNGAKFIVALTGDFCDSAGTPKYHDIGLSAFAQHPHMEHRVFKEHLREIGPDQIGEAQGVIVLSPAVTAQSVSNAENLLVVARFGVGYDTVDVKACTAADVLVTITTGAVDRPVAEATVGWMIALTHHMRIKDHLLRTGHWDERSKFMGCELRGRTLGVIGLGGIARKTIELLRSFGMNQPLAYDPLIDV